MLLIVPEGIETIKDRILTVINPKLLIVPEGIETFILLSLTLFINAFNRTRRN